MLVAHGTVPSVKMGYYRDRTKQGVSGTSQSRGGLGHQTPRGEECNKLLLLGGTSHHQKSSYVPVGHLYVFFGKMPTQILCPFCHDYLGFGNRVAWDMYMSWVLTLAGYTVCKYLLPFSRLPFCFVDGFLRCAKASKEFIQMANSHRKRG